MKKTNYHVNPAVNKWEEEQRRARMEKMIQRAKSTLPPEARGGAKTSGPKKPSPYTAENNATKPAVRKRSTTGGQGTPSGAAAVNVQELDSLIYNRVQEILGMPLMRRAAAARSAPKAGGPPKPPASGRGGRRPAWNEDWSAPATNSPSNHEERHIGGVGSGSGASNATVAYERSPSKSAGVPKPRPSPTHGAAPTVSPTKGSRIPGVPARLEVPASGSSLGGGLQRRPSGRAPGAAEERVVLLPSPSPAAGASRTAGPQAGAGRPPSSRYGSGAGAAAGAGEPPGSSQNLLEQSVVAAIEALNPHAPAAREAASRIAQHQFQQQTQQQHQQGQRDERPAGMQTSSGGSMGGMGAGASHGSSFRGSADAGGGAAVAAAAGRHLTSSSASALGASGRDRDRDASLMQSLTAAAAATSSQGGAAGASSVTASYSRRPPLAPASVPRASGRGVPQAAAAAAHHHGGAGPKDKGGEEEEEDAYADDDFEEYEGSDEEGGGAAGDAAAAADDGEQEDEGDEGGGRDADGLGPDVALLRDSVNALNGLVQLKIQQELARSQQRPGSAAAACEPAAAASTPLHRRSSQTGGGAGAGGGAAGRGRMAVGAPADVLASLALVGSDEPSAGSGHAPGRGDLANSSLGDGLRQSDLDYLARLGGGDPHDGAEVAASTDERSFVIEPGAPAGTAKAWGDRQPWTTGAKDDESGPTGLLKLRARQEREQREREQAAGGGQLQGRLVSSSREGVVQRSPAAPVAGSVAEPPKALQRAAAADEEEDSVLLGETFTPRQRTGAAAQMAAVGSALAALASLGQLRSEEAAELRTQTDALFGSLVQLHNLMNGPRGAELCSGSPTSSHGGGGGSGGSGGGGARGFTPTDMSPVASPSQTARRPAPLAAGPMDPVEGEQQQQQQSKAGGGGEGAHLQLTPKHQLVAEDVAWMAGLVHSLSRSLHVENGEVDLPGV